jgi:hypothetical protein
VALSILYVGPSTNGTGDGSSVTNRCAWGDATHVAAAAGTQVRVLSGFGEYTVAAALTYTNAGTVVSPIETVGATVDGTVITPKRKDGGFGGLDYDGGEHGQLWPVLNLDAGIGLIGTHKAFHNYRYLRVSASIDAYAIVGGAGGGVLDSISVVNASTNASAGGINAGANILYCFNCDSTVDAAAEAGIKLGAINTAALCRTAGGVYGFHMAGRNTLVECIAANPATAQFYTTVTTAIVLVRCTGYGGTDGLKYENVAVAAAPVVLIDCHLTDGTGYAFNSTVANNGIHVINTRYRDFATGTSQNMGNGADAWTTIADDAGGIESDLAGATTAVTGNFRPLAGSAAAGRGLAGGDLGALRAVRVRALRPR